MINLGSGIRSFTDRLTSTGWTSLLTERGIRYKLHFFAPEQTGRLAAEPDTRTDVYALGIGLWSYLAGIMPYKESDPLEIIQSVLSQKLRPIRAIRPDIPPQICMVLAKMTKKALSERYNSITSVKHDLQQIKSLLSAGETNALDAFKIAQEDISANFAIPNSLIGRPEETKIVMESVEKTLEAMEDAERSHTHIISVSGERGIGKTFFMRNMQQNIRQKAITVSAQFERTRSQPLDPISTLR